MEITDLTFDARDEFKRKKVAENIISLLQADIDISPMVIDGDWGTGKSEFCFKLINLMRESNSHHSIYINTFKADHANEPLMTVLAEVIKVLPDSDSKDSLIKNALPAIRYGLKTLAKAGVSHILRQDVTDAVDDFDKEIQDAADTIINSSIETMLKDHVEAEESLKTLQTALSKIAEDKPIVIFIDELDRCRPNFATDMLEVIKHVFDIDNVSFVLITNIQQLKASINHCYGEAIDAQRYLDKFIKFSIKLPNDHKAISHDINKNSLAHYEQLIQKSESLQKCELDARAFLEFIEELISIHSISLRETETFVRHLEIYQILTNNEGLSANIPLGNKLLLLLGVAIYTFSPSLTKDFESKVVDAKQLGAFLQEDELGELGVDHPNPKQILAVILGQECHINSNIFTPHTENKSEWEDQIRLYFSSFHMRLSIDTHSDIIRKVIRTFSLSN
jgi:hypothetical protein